MCHRKGRRLAAVVVAGLVMSVLAACGSANNGSPGPSSGSHTTGASSGAGAKGTVNIAYIDELTGPLAYLASRDAAQAAVDAANANGGVNGYKINMKVYDAGGSPATGVAAVRQAINDQPVAVLSATGSSYDSGLRFLAQSGIPGFNPGGTPGWFTSADFFPWEGVTFGASTTAYVKYCIDDVGKKIAIPGSTTPGVETVANTWAAMAQKSGGQVVFKEVGIDSSNDASIMQVATRIKDSGAQCVLSLLIPGSPQLQVALNQLGAKIPVVEVDSYGPEIEQQLGSSADGMLYANYFTSLQNTSDPGVKQYFDDMKKYEPNANPVCLCATGYATVKLFLHALAQVKGTPTAAKVKAAANQTNGFTAGGLVAPIEFPRNRTEPGLCLGYSQLRGGKWTFVDGQGVNGMVCGQPFKPGS